MTENQRNIELEPTITPIRRPAATASGGSGEPPRSRWWPVLGVLGAVALLAALVGVFFYLPARLEQARLEAEAEAAAAAAAAAPPPVETAPVDTGPVLTAEERAALQARAESLLAALLEQRQHLDTLSAASWGDVTWSSYETAARLADEALLAEDVAEAVEQYELALETGEGLLARSAQIIDEALAAGDAAIAGGDAELATSQYAVVLAIEPDHAAALRGQARAATLPDVLAAARRGSEAEDAGDLEAAAAAYREALAIDADWSAARVALESVNARISEARFERLLEEAFVAVEGGNYKAATDSFNAALALRPDSAAARDGLELAEQNQLLDSVRMAEVRGRASETTERWDQAIERYREALAADPTLQFAIEGLERAQRRADLAAKVQALIDSPRLLLTDEVLADGRRLLDEARAIEAPGPQHRQQIDQLAALLVLASTPITVVLESDGVTEVSVHRVGALGSFTQQELELRPGSYIAVGQRRGFRDVRVNFSILPGAANEPVRVACTEPI